MCSFNPFRLFAGSPRRSAPVDRRSLSAVLGPVPEPTVYADAPLTRLLMAIDRRGASRRVSDLEPALAEYARARRAAGVQPEAMLIEFKRVLRRAIGMDPARPRLTGRLIELYFAG
jgi:hypothetical protein